MKPLLINRKLRVDSLSTPDNNCIESSFNIYYQTQLTLSLLFFWSSSSEMMLPKRFFWPGPTEMHIYMHRTHTTNQLTGAASFHALSKILSRSVHVGDHVKVWILKGEKSHSKCISPPFLLLSESCPNPEIWLWPENPTNVSDSMPLILQMKYADSDSSEVFQAITATTWTANGLRHAHFFSHHTLCNSGFEVWKYTVTHVHSISCDFGKIKLFADLANPPNLTRTGHIRVADVNMGGTGFKFESWKVKITPKTHLNTIF